MDIVAALKQADTLRQQLDNVRAAKAKGKH